MLAFWSTSDGRPMANMAMSIHFTVGNPIMIRCGVISSNMTVFSRSFAACLLLGRRFLSRMMMSRTPRTELCSTEKNWLCA